VIYGKTQSSCRDFDARLGHFHLKTVGLSLETADLSVSETADCHHYHPCIFTFRVRMDPDIIATRSAPRWNLHMPRKLLIAYAYCSRFLHAVLSEIHRIAGCAMPSFLCSPLAKLCEYVHDICLIHSTMEHFPVSWDRSIHAGWTVAHIGYCLQIPPVSRQLNGQSKIQYQGGAARSTEAAEQKGPGEIQRQVSS
jgi:hypothetical protein